MSDNIIVDQAACTGCGLCAKVCGSRAIAVTGGCAAPSRPTLCCSCGHCAAICPAGAISANHEGNRRQFAVTAPDGGLGPVESVLRSKRSVREFKHQALGRDVLERLVEYAERAPSSGNNRHRRYLVVTDPDRIDAMEHAVLASFETTRRLLNPVLLGATRLVDDDLARSLAGSREDIDLMLEEAANGRRPIFRNAPCVVCVSAPSRDIQAGDDCVIALQYMMLYAETQGLGSCVIGYAQYAHRSLGRVIDLPKGHRIYAAGIFGYPRHSYRREIRYTQVPEVIWS